MRKYRRAVGIGRGIDGVYPTMNTMDRLVRLMRIELRGFALILGSLGIFCLYWSCTGVPVAADAFMFLGTATAITLATASEKRLRRLNGISLRADSPPEFATLQPERDSAADSLQIAQSRALYSIYACVNWSECSESDLPCD